MPTPVAEHAGAVGSYESTPLGGQHVAVSGSHEWVGGEWKQHNGYSVAVIAIVVKSRHTFPVTQRSPGRPAIPVDRILTAALQIVDERGADALSMRTLAQRLNSGTATLYRHFTSRADLIARLVDLVSGSVEIDDAQLRALPWPEACKTVARTVFEALRQHPNVAPLLAEDVPIGPNAMGARERLIAILLDNGFPPALAARSYATLARYILGFAIQLTNSSGDVGLNQAFRELDRRRYPAIAKVSDHLPVPLDDEFAFGLDLIIDGLTQELRRHPRRRKVNRRD
jgi:AcrR family transcriptional regulator